MMLTINVPLTLVSRSCACPASTCSGVRLRNQHLPAVVDRAGPHGRRRHHRRREHQRRPGGEVASPPSSARSASSPGRPAAAAVGQRHHESTPGPATRRSWRTCPASAWPSCWPYGGFLVIDGAAPDRRARRLQRLHRHDADAVPAARLLHDDAAAGRRLGRAHLRDPRRAARDRRPARRRRPRRPRRAGSSSATSRFGYGDDGPDVLDGFSLARRARRDGRPRRPHRQRQVDRDPPAPPLLRRHAAARCSSTATTSATSR